METAPQTTNSSKKWLFIGLGAVLALGLLAILLTRPESESTKVTNVRMTVTLGKITPSAVEVPHGKVRLFVKNASDGIHSIFIWRTHPGKELPTEKDTKMIDDEEIPFIDHMGSIGDIDPGKTNTIMLNLTKGTYLVACNVVSTGETSKLYSHSIKERSVITAK